MNKQTENGPRAADTGAAEPSRVEMVSRDCPVCGSADASRVFAEADFDFARLDRFAFASRKLPEYMHYRLVSCPDCDLLYAAPLPVLDTLADAYRDADFDSSEEAHYAARTYAKFLPALARRLPDRDGVLDIGTGDGAFLEELLAARFTGVLGIEPSGAPIAAAKDEVRPLIRQGLFRPEDFEGGRFSLVTCFQTLEHVYDPLAIGRGASSLLKDGGAVFFICHNRRALSARLLGERSPIFDIEHLQLFSPRSAKQLLERCGFTGIEIRGVVNRYPLHYWLKLFPISATPKRRLLMTLKKSGIGRLPLPLPVGNLAIIGYKPSRPEG